VPGQGPAPEPLLVSEAAPTQVIQLDPRVYVQNANPVAVYSQQGRALPAPATLADVPHAPATTPASGPVTIPVPRGPVTITISPLEWRTMLFAGEPALIAVRQVQTPDRSFTQGFVVDQQAMTTWLGARAGGMIPQLRVDHSAGAPVAPGLGLTVEPDPQSVMKAAADSQAIASGFVMRFVGVGAVSVLAATVVLLLVTRAESRARERSQFAAAAAHELRTPLAGLQLYGDMLADGLGDPSKVPEYARRMSDDAARLGRVVSNILGFSQLERGSLALELQTGRVDAILAELTEHARPAVERLGATLELDVTRDLRARFDRDALTRIVGNLLDNAEKYSRQSADRTIRLAASDCGHVVEVCVSDRGPGIPDSSKLFHVFSRGTSASDGPAGLGLGLALSRSLARAMGGDLAHRARDGGGATFVLQLRRG
jgi:signal transduction histidine kinase